MTIYAKVGPDTEEDLSYAVPLKGIESDIEIYINRSLEKGMCCCTNLQYYSFPDSQDLQVIQQYNLQVMLQHIKVVNTL